MSCSNRLSALWIVGSFAIIFASAVSGHSIRPTSISPEVHTVDPSADHCSVVVKRCTELKPAPYRPGCWQLTFEIVVQGQPLDLVGSVADRLRFDGSIRPRDLATLTAPSGAPIPLAPNWRTKYGPREEEFRGRLTHYRDPRRSAIRLPNGEWSVQWWLYLICETKPDGEVTVTLNGPAILAGLGYGDKVSWTSAPATCHVPREQDPIKPSGLATWLHEIWSSVTGGGVATSNVVTVVTPSWATLIEAVPDPAVVTDPDLRATIIASGFAWRVKDTGTNIEMLLIPPGSFTMGCTRSVQWGCGSSDETPTHAVTLTNAFYLARYEVTQAQWTAKIGSNPSYFQGASYPDAASRPVEMVSWNMIVPFNTATGLRLPTEAEWEYAYRAQMGTSVTRTAFHNGTNDDALLGNIAWFSGNNGASGTSTYGTKVVGGKTANALGLHDMSGNVLEWVNDWWSRTYYSSSRSTNPRGPSSLTVHAVHVLDDKTEIRSMHGGLPSGPYRVLRGGSWFNNSFFCRGSQRGFNPPDVAVSTQGFRSARTP